MGPPPHSSTPEPDGVGTTPEGDGVGTTPGGDGVGTTVYTDGACSGNPGPGGWAWVEPEGQWASGFEDPSTNQRMELTAVLRACEHFDGPLRVVSDSTYVVNCWRDGWWRGWLKRGWRNSRKEPVANRDLWEQLVPHFRDRDDLRLEWVKGHSGDRWNDLADRLAVGAVQRREGASGEGDPPPEVLGSEDRVPRTAPDADAGTREAAAGSQVSVEPFGSQRSSERRAADPRVPAGRLMAVTGLRHGSAGSSQMVSELRGVLEAHHGMHPDLVVLTGLRSGTETAAAEAAIDAGVPYVVVLPYPDPTRGWPEREAAEFQRLLDAARSVVTLEKKRPIDLEGRRAALARRDGWMRSAVDAVVFATDGRDEETEGALRRWEKALGDDLWRLDIAPG